MTQRQVGRGSDEAGRPVVLHWTAAEKDALLAALREHGRDWEALSAAVPSRTLKQIKTYWQNNRVGLRVLVDGVKRQKAQDSVAAAMSAAQAAAQAVQQPQQPQHTQQALHSVQSPTMASAAAPAAGPPMLIPSATLSSPLGLPLALPASSLSTSAQLLLLPSSVLAAASLPLALSPTVGELPGVQPSLPALSASAASPTTPFAFVAVPPSSVRSSPPASATSASSMLSTTLPQSLMLMIPPTALSPAVSPLHLSVIAAAAGGQDATAGSGGDASQSRALTVSDSAAFLHPLDVSVLQSGSAPAVAVSSVSSPASAFHSASASVSPRSPSKLQQRVSPGFDRPFTMARSAAASDLAAALLAPLVPFTSISQDVADAIAMGMTSSASTPVGSSLASPVRLPVLPSSLSSPAAEGPREPGAAFPSPTLLSLDRARERDRERMRMLSPSPSPSVSSMKGAPPSPPPTASYEESELERSLSPTTISPTSAQRAMSTFSPLSHLAHHPYSSSPPSPASEKSSPISSSPPSPTPSILSLHTLSSPSMRHPQQQPPRVRSTASSPHAAESSPSSLTTHPSRSILGGFGERDKRRAADSEAQRDAEEREEEKHARADLRRDLLAVAARSPASPLSAEALGGATATDDAASHAQPGALMPAAGSSPPPLKAALIGGADADEKDESELGELDELRDDASMMTALSAMPEPPSPKQSGLAALDDARASRAASAERDFAHRPPPLSPSSTTNLDAVSLRDEDDADAEVDADDDSDDGGARRREEGGPSGAEESACPRALSPSPSTSASAFLSPPLTAASPAPRSDASALLQPLSLSLGLSPVSSSDAAAEQSGDDPAVAARAGGAEAGAAGGGSGSGSFAPSAMSLRTQSLAVLSPRVRSPSVALSAASTPLSATHTAEAPVLDEMQQP